MKKQFVILFAVLWTCTTLPAQELALILLTPAGGYTESVQGSLSWSIGEIAIEQSGQTNAILSSGFQQIELDTNTIFLPDDPNTIKLLIPNVITPNDDGFNDLFDPIGALKKAQIQISENKAEVTIVNRWGEVVFFANNPYRPWDGKSFQGVLMPQATYYFILILHQSRDVTIRGSVHLLR